MGMDISGQIVKGLTELIGDTPTQAVISIIGEEAFKDPRIFTEKVAEVFGYGGKIIIEKLLFESEIARSTDISSAVI